MSTFNVMESTNATHLGSSSTSSSNRRQGSSRKLVTADVIVAAAPSTTATTRACSSASSSSSFVFPDWARKELEREQKTTLAQPWKRNAIAANCEADDPNFAQGQDAVMFFDKKVNVCFGEGSMAA